MTMNNKGFTMMEVIIVVVVITLAALFIIPNFETSIDRARARNVKIELQTIQGALKIYDAKHGGLGNLDLDGQDSINQTLGLQVQDKDFHHHCYPLDPDGINRFVCDAYNSAKKYTVRQYIDDGSVECRQQTMPGGGNICQSVGFSN